MAHVLTSQGSFTILTGIRRTNDIGEKVTGVPNRSAFTYQTFAPCQSVVVQSSATPDMRRPGVTSVGLRPDTVPPCQATGTVTVANNTFTYRAVLYIGPYKLVSNQDYTVGAGVNDTATALAAAIDALPNLSASANLAVVSVTWTDGATVDGIRFEAEYFGTTTNFTLSNSTGFLAVASTATPFGPPELTDMF